MISSLAYKAMKMQTPKDRTFATPYGLVVHTTGSGLPAEAIARNEDPLRTAERIYTAPGAFYPHYVIGWNGALLAICDENGHAQHVASPDATKHAAYMDGSWVDKTPSKRGVQLWQERWVARASPAHLYPGYSPNDVYLGVELVPNPTGARFTDDQMAMLAKLCDDIETRHKIILDGPRLVGHEDLAALDPDSRWTSSGGWDPGALNDTPTFSWQQLALLRHAPALT